MMLNFKKCLFVVASLMTCSLNIFAMEPEDLGQTYVHIWLPKKDAYGHVAVHTPKYHMSLWPDGDVKKQGALSTVGTYFNGMKAALHLHPIEDEINEDMNKPVQIAIPNCDMAKVNAKFEEILKYNDINPKDAEYEIINPKVEEFLKKYGDLNPKERRKDYQQLGLSVSIPRTKWSQTGYQRFFFDHSFREPDFYKYEQSCTTFAAGLLIACGVEFPYMGEAPIPSLSSLACGKNPCQDPKYLKSVKNTEIADYLNCKDPRFLEVREFYDAIKIIWVRHQFPY